jgi:hypothetical protein
MSARYVVDEKGERREVILPVEEYERLRIAGEETEKMGRHPGVVFEGPAGRRRASVSGSVFDVWEIVDLYRDKGRERLFAEHPISERQLDSEKELEGMRDPDVLELAISESRVLVRANSGHAH